MQKKFGCDCYHSAIIAKMGKNGLYGKCLWCSILLGENAPMHKKMDDKRKKPAARKGNKR